MRRWLLLQIPLAIVLVAIGFTAGLLWPGRGSAGTTPTMTPQSSKTATFRSTATGTATPTRTPTATASPTASGTSTPSGPPTQTLTPSTTPTVTLTPTYDPPQARVLIQSNCRYGPGAAYLYEWGLFPGNRLEIIGRNDLGTWLYVDPWTYVDRCWVKADYVDVFRGDIFDAPPFYSRLPFGELYRPPSNVWAERNGDLVTVTWNAVWMTEDDYRGYLIEAWVCRDRQIVFEPVGITVGTSATILDEQGCTQRSSARLYTAEKHGYTQWVMVPWPQHPTPTPGPGGVTD